MSSRPLTTVLFKRLPHGKDVRLPEQATELSSGFDLRACLDTPVELPPGGRTAVPTGLAIAVPEDFEAQVRPRSGLALRRGLAVLNSPGTIDADYRGEIRVILANLGTEPLVIKDGDRIAQMVVQQVPRVFLREVGELPETTRGEGGFGHTGTS